MRPLIEVKSIVEQPLKHPQAIRLSTIISLIFCLGCVFPFLSPYPINTDTQPIAHFAALLLVGYVSLIKGLKAIEVFLILASTLLLLYLNPVGSDSVDLGKYVALPLGAFIFIAIRKVNDQLLWGVIKLAILSYFISAILITIAPSIMLPVQSYFVREINVAQFDHSAFVYRGVPALATEPGLLGGLLVFLLIQVRYIQSKLALQPNKVLLYKLMLIATILMTRSGTGYLYLFLYYIVSWFDYSTHKIRDGFLLCVVLLFVAASLAHVAETVGINNRGLEILYGIGSGQTFGQDTSVLKRLYDVSIGFISLIEHPFGVGANNVASTVNSLAIEYGLLRAADFSREIELVSGVGWMCVAFGFIGILYLTYLFFYLSSASWVHKVFAFVFLSISYSPAFPAIWILLSQSHSKSKLQITR